MGARAACVATAVAAVSWGFPALEAQGPAFDCGRVQGEAEQTICKDPTLASLDRKLDEVYKAAAAKSQGQLLATLEAEQRGWISGRNECWKAQGPGNPVFLTASWQVTSLRECVEAQYKIRTAELQSRYRLLTPTKPIFFACHNNPANEVVATFFGTDPPTARLERGDRTVTAYLVPAGSGAKYEGQNVTFWNKGDEATVTWMNPATGVTEELQCRARP